MKIYKLHQCRTCNGCAAYIPATSKTPFPVCHLGTCIVTKNGKDVPVGCCYKPTSKEDLRFVEECFFAGKYTKNGKLKK